MKQKTRLSPMEQWDRTVAYWVEQHHHGEAEEAHTSEWCWYTDTYNDWLLGVIAKPTKLFNAGDLVITYRSNGSVDRLNAYAISSKGYPVKWTYLPYDSAGADSTATPLASIDLSTHARSEFQLKHRTLYIPEPPFYLSHRSPYDARVREYVAALHDGTADKLIAAAAETIDFVRVDLEHSTGLSAKDSSRPGDTTYTVSCSELRIDDPVLMNDLSTWVQSRYIIGPDGKYPPADRLNAAGLELTERVQQRLGNRVQVTYAEFTR